jgi:hypothetical protein
MRIFPSSGICAEMKVSNIGISVFKISYFGSLPLFCPLKDHHSRYPSLKFFPMITLLNEKVLDS